MAELITAKQQLIDLINQDNGTALTAQDVTLSPPVMENYMGRNTRVTVTANPGSRFRGSMDVYYQRLALSSLGYVGILSATPLTPEELLQAVSTQKGIDLLPEEFETFTIPVLEVGEVGQIWLAAKETAIKWYGEAQVNFTFNLPPELDTLHQWLHVSLSAPGYFG